MIRELTALCGLLASTMYGRKKELNVMLKSANGGAYLCLVEEPTTSSHRIGALKGSEPSTPFTIAFVTKVPLQRESVENIDIIERGQYLCNSLLEKIAASRQFRIVDGAVSGRKVEETEYDICMIGWRITVNLIDLKRVKC